MESNGGHRTGESSDADADVLADVVERHATEAAFLWSRRDAAARSPVYNLDDLCELDDRLECHLDGLRNAGEAGWAFCAAELSDDAPGVVFPAAVLAVERKDWTGFAAVLDAGTEELPRGRALVSALGFLPLEALDVVWKGMLAPGAPAPLLHFGLAGHAAHRADLGKTLRGFASVEDMVLRARAYRAIGELGRQDLARTLHAGTSDTDETCRFWAAWSATLLGETWALTTLTDLVASERYGEKAADMAVRGLPLSDARKLVESLIAKGTSRTAISAVGSLGDPTFLPWLVGLLGDKDAGRLAAWSITMITNANVTDEMHGKPHKEYVPVPNDDAEDEDVSMDPDDDLPWPDVEKLTRWVSEQSLTPGTRHLLGKPLDLGWISHVLRTGNQVARAAAAIELRLRTKRDPLFEVRAPGYRQLGMLGG